MKTAVLCMACAVGAFVFLQFQLGGSPSEADPGDVAVNKEPPKTAQFPEDLAPAARGAPIPEAAVFSRSADPHPTAILTRSGKLHSWHERQPPGWQAESVESTELILIVSNQRRTLLQTVNYSNGAPSVRRYKYDLDAWIVEARTGKIITSKRFVSEARPIQPLERWELTELGDPVECRDVNQWLRETATSRAEETVEDIRH